MEAIAIEALGAIAIIISAIIGSVVATKKLNQTVAVHDTKADNNKANLSQEHTGLKEQIAQVGNATKEQLSREFAQVGSTVTFLKEEQIRESAERRALQGQPLDIQKTVQHIAAQQALLTEILQENAQLKLQLQQERTSRQTAERETAALHAQLQEQEYEQE